MDASTPRPRAEDGIRQRPNGLWEARYQHPDIPGSRGRRSAYGKTKAEAKANRTAELAKAQGGLPPVDRRTQVGTLFRRWVAIREEQGAKANTLASYRVALRRVDLDPIAKARVYALEADDVYAFVGRMRDAGLGPNTVRGYVRVLGSAVQFYVKTGRLHRNVVRYVRVPMGPKSATIPTKAEVRAIMGAAHDYHYGAAVVLPLFAGLRLGEVLALRWGDIGAPVDRHGVADPGALAIHVARNWTRPTGPQGEPAAMGSTKNSRDRYVPIPQGSPLYPFLYAVRDLVYGEGVIPHPGALVFPSTRYPGKPIGTRTLESAWELVRRKAGVRLALRFHDLRHAYATALLDRQVPLEDVSVLLGHADPAFTAKVYGHRDRAAIVVPADLYALGGTAG
jgi:integrase